MKEKEKSFSRKRKKKKINKEDKEEKIIHYYVVAGRAGVIFLDSMFQKLSEEEKKEKEKNNFNIEEDIAYRSVIQLNEKEIAVSSNAILDGGKDKLIIYDISNKKMQKELEGYSFIISDNGMYLLSPDILLCACKKYLQNQKNGILLILLPPSGAITPTITGSIICLELSVARTKGRRHSTPACGKIRATVPSYLRFGSYLYLST